MKLCIVGAGAIGGFIGARVAANTDAPVSALARGATLAALRRHGWRLRLGDRLLQAPAHASDDPTELGVQDVVVIAVKAPSLETVAGAIGPLIGPNTTVLSTQNGVPWWYFENETGELAGLRLESVDPGGVIAASIPARSVVGSLVYFATDLAGPGVVRHIEGNRISLGEPDGTRSDRIKGTAEAFIKAGLRAPVTTRLRSEMFVKLLGNAAFNPISALTRATLVKMAQDRHVRALVTEIMTEVSAVATRLGITLPVSIEQRIAGAEAVGEHKTSMLQDLELGRPMELDCIAGALVELGTKLEIPMPNLKAVYALTKLLGETAQAAKAS